MRKNNELNIFKSQKNNPRILKISQLIKKTHPSLHTHTIGRTPIKALMQL